MPDTIVITDTAVSASVMTAAIKAANKDVVIVKDTQGKVILGINIRDNTLKEVVEFLNKTYYPQYKPETCEAIARGQVSPFSLRATPNTEALRKRYFI